ncbi:MAG: CRTAC1 family protein [Phycisphaerales bacterium]|nr:CRTAC1 family protein [Phycisphaerales bacterium]
MNHTKFAIACLLSTRGFASAQIALTPIDAGHLTSDHKSNGGVSMLDFDGDGNADILVTAGYDVSKKPERQPSRLYWGNGKGQFSLDENNTLTNAITYGSGSTWADFDNDGNLDAVISCQLGSGSVLARGLGNRRFEIIEASPVHTDKGNAFSSVFADVDSDGALDLLMCNNAYAGPDVSFLYKGDGKGGFTRITREVAERKSSTGGAYFGDLDGDGKPDLFMPNNSGKAALFRNTGDWNLVPATIAGLDLNPFPVSGSCWVDYNNDGQLDLSMACAQGGNALLFKNVGATLEPAQLGDAALFSTNAGLLQWGDLDNDGDLDCIVPNWGAGSFIYQNQGDGTFKRIALPGFTDQVFYASSCALTDYDNDGRVDVLLGQWPVRPGDGELTKLFHNDTPNPSNWVKVKLKGTTSNRAAIGARITVRATIRNSTVNQLREVNAGSGFRSQSDLTQHFGLGDAKQINEIEIRWPSGKTQLLKNQPANQIIEITEPS